MRNKLNGFSLIELLVVIAIIAILIAFLIPRYRLYTQRAQVSAAFALAEQVQKNIEQFYSKNGRFPLSAGEATYDRVYNGAVVLDVMYYGCVQSNAHQFTIDIQPSVVGVGNGNTIDFVGVETNGVIKWYCRKTGGVPISPDIIPNNCMSNASLNSVCNNPATSPTIVDP